MAAIQSKTRQELRLSIGYQLGAVNSSTTTAAGTTNTFIDDSLFGGNDNYNGYWVVFTSGNNSGTIARIKDYDSSTYKITLQNYLSSIVASGTTYEMYDSDVPPARIHDFINRSISTITRKGAPPMTDFTLHTSRQVYSYALPSTMIGVQKVEYRQKYFAKSLFSCDSVFDEVTSGVTSVVVDTKDYRQGSGANKMVIPSGTGTNAILISDSISSTDISGYTHLEFWIKSNVALTAGQFAVRVSAVANNATSGVYEDVSVPATSVDTWTHHRVALSSAENLTAIISVGLIQVADIGAATVSIDNIEATRDYGSLYEEVHKNFYTIDRANSRLVFDANARAVTSHSLLKLTGVNKPTLLTAESTSCDVEPEYIIHKSTAMALNARSDRSADRRQASQLDAERYNLLAEQILAKSQTPQRCIWVD
tara:strand:- start:186 stop:1454 length:1269 start_codon:yes stop_codon:yes gene_type:complete